LKLFKATQNHTLHSGYHTTFAAQVLIQTATLTSVHFLAALAGGHFLSPLKLSLTFAILSGTSAHFAKYYKTVIFCRFIKAA